MKKFDEINIIPFIDIMLVLLAIVLVTASFISQGKIQVNVPKATTTQNVKADDLAKLITITADNQFYFNDKPTDKEQLTNEIRTWDKAQRVTLKVDGAVSFEKFVELTDLLSANDIKNVGIITRKDNGK
ncbi:TonB system transport protein ExbD [Haemophilus sputorum]|jgi:tonB system transport protein exbD|uniref:Biopolymer transport protein ExbD n=1 Tax=Haemophilus sputorum TaxID=1078480 RepID=A0A369YDB2_9PAST|nr:TonB system transport protein ExbD [Haemophilus sputorum]EJP26794.1 TonB system transport protein ExbD [Haemophilus sputorum HK 2154]MCQ1857324.1 TonB system transport protein ExbD [Haemophilus sputorum]RDE70316.1 TonB system transport protein ExbD [Haemophilus sputorum]RDF07450.1 TonB system transport protein ExbD [Haemophilus sputorum]RDF11133.1 TonB system transport protein ExbD [Haemophilus sputorum]